MRVSGRTHAAFIPLTSWTKMGSLSREKLSCLFLQVGEFSHHFLIFAYLQLRWASSLRRLSQVAGFVWERVWPGWNSSSSSPPSFSTFVSLLLLEFQRMNWIWLQVLAPPSVQQPINWELFLVCKQLFNQGHNLYCHIITAASLLQQLNVLVSLLSVSQMDLFITKKEY